MILPKKENENKISNPDAKDTAKSPGVKLPVSNSSYEMQKLSIGVKIETDNYECYQTFKCPPMEIYNVLTMPELLRAFTNSDTQCSAMAGGKFSLLGGHVSGEFIELVSIISSDSTESGKLK